MPRPSTAFSISLPQLERLIQSRRHELKRLERTRAKYQRKLNALDQRIRALGGSFRGARNGSNLPDAIAKVLYRSSAPLGGGDIAQRVQAAGYRSASANFRGIVNQALIKDRRFVSEARGSYRLRATTSAK